MDIEFIGMQDICLQTCFSKQHVKQFSPVKFNIESYLPSAVLPRAICLQRE